MASDHLAILVRPWTRPRCLQGGWPALVLVGIAAAGAGPTYIAAGCHGTAVQDFLGWYALCAGLVLVFMTGWISYRTVNGICRAGFFETVQLTRVSGTAMLDGIVGRSVLWAAVASLPLAAVLSAAGLWWWFPSLLAGATMFAYLLQRCAFASNRLAPGGPLWQIVAVTLGYLAALPALMALFMRAILHDESPLAHVWLMGLVFALFARSSNQLCMPRGDFDQTSWKRWLRPAQPNPYIRAWSKDALAKRIAREEAARIPFGFCGAFCAQYGLVVLVLITLFGLLCNTNPRQIPLTAVVGIGYLGCLLGAQLYIKAMHTLLRERQSNTLPILAQSTMRASEYADGIARALWIRSIVALTPALSLTLILPVPLVATLMLCLIGLAALNLGLMAYAGILLGLVGRGVAGIVVTLGTGAVYCGSLIGCCCALGAAASIWAYLMAFALVTVVLAAGTRRVALSYLHAAGFAR